MNNNTPRPINETYEERLARVIRNTQRDEPSWVSQLLGPRPGWRRPHWERRTY